MIRLKQLLFEQTGNESIQVNGKSVTGTKVTNTQNPRDPYTYFVGNDGQYYAAGKKGIWRNLKTSLRPADYKLAVSRIDSWKPAQSTPTAETPAEPNADIPSAETPTEPSAVPNADMPSAVPSKYTTTYTDGKPSIAKWKKWNRDGYDITPGVRPPDDNTLLFDSGISAVGNTESAVQLQLQTMLRAKGIYVLDAKVGLIVSKTLDNGNLESRWLTYLV